MPLEYKDGKRLEERFKELIALKAYQNCTAVQLEQIEKELDKIRGILPDDVTSKLEREVLEKRSPPKK
jgi:hypothetical protein